MPITREDIEKRLALLRAEYAQVTANLVQLEANKHAYEGAIQECELWLNMLGPAQEQTENRDK